METNFPQASREARRLASRYLSSMSALSHGLAASQPAKVLHRLIERGERDAEFEALLGADGAEAWEELRRLILASSSRGGRLLLCEAAIQAAKRSVMAADWLVKLAPLSEVRAEHGEPAASLARRLRPLLEQAAAELLEVYTP